MRERQTFSHFPLPLFVQKALPSLRPLLVYGAAPHKYMYTVAAAAAAAEPIASLVGHKSFRSSFRQGRDGGTAATQLLGILLHVER